MSSDPDAKYFPSPENTTIHIQLECPVRVLMRSPLDTIHNPIVKSIDSDAKYIPSSENTGLYTEAECPVRVFIRSPLDTLHNTIVQP